MARFKNIKRRHNLPSDYTCNRCGWLVQAMIPHECDPSICPKCDGAKTEFVGRVNGEWIGYVPCDKCDGTGKTVFD